jgi:S-ribosylhomocysteine lyase LuxS involved in autoinducer biosynthesis
MESKKLHTLEWKVRNYMRQHEQQQVKLEGKSLFFVNIGVLVVHSS